MRPVLYYFGSTVLWAMTMSDLPNTAQQRSRVDLEERQMKLASMAWDGNSRRERMK